MFNRKIFIIVTLVLMLSLSLSLSSSFAESKSKIDIQSERNKLIKDFDVNVEQMPKGKSITERQNESESFKNRMNDLAVEESSLGIDANEDKILSDYIEYSKEGYQLLINSYENDKSYLSNPNCKLDYERTKKQLDYINQLEKDYKEGKLTSSEGISKFEKVKDIK